MQKLDEKRILTSIALDGAGSVLHMGDASVLQTVGKSRTVGIEMRAVIKIATEFVSHLGRFFVVHPDSVKCRRGLQNPRQYCARSK